MHPLNRKLSGHLGSSVSTHLFQERPLSLVIEANQLLHYHHLPCLPVGHLLQDKHMKLSNKLRDIILMQR